MGDYVRRHRRSSGLNRRNPFECVFYDMTGELVDTDAYQDNLREYVLPWIRERMFQHRRRKLDFENVVEVWPPTV
jgi:hypothetical protein